MRHRPHDQALRIRTARISIRPAAIGDIETTWGYRRLPEVTEFLPRAPDTLPLYAEQFLASPRLERTLVIEHDGTLVGDLYLFVHDADGQAETSGDRAGRQAEIGWVLDPVYAGRGLATEAVEALLRLCFEDLGVHRVVASCYALNEASWRLMERVGMRRETRTLRSHLHRARGWSDLLGYALLDQEWHERH